MAQDNENPTKGGLEATLNSVLSDPESMSKLASMASALASSGVLSGLAGNLGGEKQSVDAVPTDGSTEKENTLPKHVVVNEKMPSVPGVSGRHTALLRAIKPYLGLEKQARVDQMVKLLQLAELADTVLRGSQEGL